MLAATVDEARSLITEQIKPHMLKQLTPDPVVADLSKDPLFAPLFAVASETTLRSAHAEDAPTLELFPPYVAVTILPAYYPEQTT